MRSFSGKHIYQICICFSISNLVTDTVYISSLGTSVNVLDDQTIMFTSNLVRRNMTLAEENLIKFQILKTLMY